MAPEPTESDEARWARWDDLRVRKAAATTDGERARLALEEGLLRLHGTAELAAQDQAQPGGWWWLSFADGSLPAGEQFLGVAIVPGGGVMEAALNARLLGCNPGGQVLGTQIRGELVPEKYRNRLLSKQELEEEGLA